MTESEKEDLIGFRTRKLVKQHTGNRVLYWVLLIMTILVTASAVYSLVKCILGSGEMLETYINQIQMCVLAIVCLNIPVFFQKKLKVRIPDFIAVIVYCFIFIHFILGEIYRFYDHYILFDKVLHTTGGAIIAFIGFSVVLSFTNLESKKVKLSPFFIVLFSFCFALSIEYIWELVEYAVDTVTYRLSGFIGASNMQRWKDGIVTAGGAPVWAEGGYVTSSLRGTGLKDSMMDMLVNIIGAAVVCGVALIGLKLRPDWFEGKRLMSYKKIPEYVRENVERMSEEEFSAAYARMLEEKENAEKKDLRRKKLLGKDGKGKMKND